MAMIPEVLIDHINGAFPKNVCLVSIVTADGYGSISPRGSMQVFDENTLAYWDRGTGQSHDLVKNGTKITVYYRNSELGAHGGSGLLPAGGIARFSGIAEVYAEDGEIREKVWTTMVQPERDRDPDKKGSAVLLRLKRAEQLNGKPLSEIGG